MIATNKFNILKQILLVASVFLTGCVAIIFSVLYLQTFQIDILLEYTDLISAGIIVLVVSVCVLILSLDDKPETVIFKLAYILIILVGVLSPVAYLLKMSGFFNKIQSLSEFQDYIKSFGGYAVFIFITVQFLQVVVLPIPSFITIGVGVLLFGPFKCAIYSFLGIFSGSLFAFYIGRFLGVKIVKWVIGEKSLKKVLDLIKGKNELLLTIMFLFPFFPDDALCFVSGITSISSKFYFYMVLFTRLITVFLSAYSINNSIIPYNTWWGILVWGLFFVFTIAFVIFIYKYSDKIKGLFSKPSK